MMILAPGVLSEPLFNSKKENVDPVDLYALQWFIFLDQGEAAAVSVRR